MRIAFAVLRIGMVVLALVWLTSNVRQVPPGMQALTLRSGRIAGVTTSGLVLAWPRPIEHVILLPSRERQIQQTITPDAPPQAAIAENLADIPDDAVLCITGDGGLVLIDATLSYRITDAADYFVAESHVAAALNRAFAQAALYTAATHPLDDFLAVRPEQSGPATDAARATLRTEITDAIGRRLAPLHLGIEVTRTDLAAHLPPAAKPSFDAVLDATQRAEQALATARTDAERTRQEADRQHDSTIAQARAAATESVATARAATATITSLEHQGTPQTRPALLNTLYREKIATVLNQAASVTTVDAKAVSRVIIPGAGP